ncbi:MAG: DNA polymerase III subunit gamma/tau [Endomicrobium sp.]|jgi:DNA polymerase-3 subunit gamma/tau|nr:DNA polymerase III subunit gamma/tau [Endomicrobium sp.]
MSYLVLARKFRPQNFSEIIGQEHISQTLRNAISEKRIAHAYLFSGPRGCGKTTMARVLAKALNCKNGPTVEPCGICENCLAISKSSSIDVLEIDGASNNGIDEIRALRENVKFSSANSKYKIYIMDEVHQITIQAFNALLKTLEEPPSHVVFIMATTEQHKVPATILSRCQRYMFKLISSAEISFAIKSIGRKEGFEIDDEAVGVITSASSGSMRDALSLLEQAVSSSSGKVTGACVRELLGLLPKDALTSVTESILKGDIQKILKIVEEIFEQGYDILQFARDLRDYLREVMVYSINPSGIEISSDDKRLFDVQKTLFSLSRYVRMNNLLSKALEEMRWHDRPRILLEIYLLKMAEPYYNVGELIDRVVELEKNIKIENKPGFTFKNRYKRREEFSVDKASNRKDLIGIWGEIVSEIIKKHPLTGQSLKNALAEAIGTSSVQLTVLKQFDYDGVLEFRNQILELFQKKSGLNIEIKVFIRKNMVQNKVVTQGDVVVGEKSLSSDAIVCDVKKNVDEDEKSSIPKYIEEIAKSFGAVAKKV